MFYCSSVVKNTLVLFCLQIVMYRIRDFNGIVLQATLLKLNFSVAIFAINKVSVKKDPVAKSGGGGGGNQS